MSSPEDFRSNTVIHRHALERVDKDWLQAQKNHSESRFLIYQNGKYPVDKQFHLKLLTVEEVAELANFELGFYYLAEIINDAHQYHVFCAQLDNPLANNYRWRTLRHTNITDELTQLAMQAQGLLNWQKVCCYCEQCGSELQGANDEQSKICTNPDCHRVVFPRINPAVIVLVTYEDKCLLANAHRFKGDIPMYSCLAGYVETGETFEATLEREVMEEVGIELFDCEYIDNQPWPFPSSLMIGFHAQAKSTELTFHDGEIKAARWFNALELQSALKSNEIILPSEQSIAYRLVDLWLQRTVSIDLAHLQSND